MKLRDVQRGDNMGAVICFVAGDVIGFFIMAMMGLNDRK